MSVYLIYDVEYEVVDDNGTSHWELLKQDIGTFQCNPLREFLRDSDVGYNYLPKNVNKGTLEHIKKLGDGDERRMTVKVIYLSQVKEIIAEANKFIRSYADPETKDEMFSVKDAIKGLTWIIKFLFDDSKIHEPIIDEQIRIIFYYY